MLRLCLLNILSFRRRQLIPEREFKLICISERNFPVAIFLENVNMEQIIAVRSLCVVLANIFNQRVS